MPWPTTSRHERGYGAAHDRMRKHLKATVIFCEECTRRGRATLGDCADHIVPLAKGGTHDRSNYQWLCGLCHDEKTARENGVKHRPRIGLDGWPIQD